MRTYSFLGLVLALGFVRALSASAVTAPVATTDLVWHDVARNRDVPARLYYPAGDARGPFPVIVFSHGLGGSREGYRYLGEYWAAHGYVSVHLQHPGSDVAVWQGQPPRQIARRMKAAVMDPANAINRPLDVRFAIDELERLARDPHFVLHDRLDLSRLGIAGHSFGAYTVLAVSGQVIAGGLGPAKSLGPDPRVKAAIAMSSQRPRRGDLDVAYDPIAIPVFHMTGTADGSGRNAAHGNDLGVGNSTPADRRVAYDHTRHAPAYLLTFTGGDHMVFSGQRRRGAGTHDKEFHDLILRASVAFWDAELKGDAAARQWLAGGGFAKELGALGTFEQKRPAR
jgi:fermentation-respiration switch protein FrsA (DUF1100 family)